MATTKKKKTTTRKKTSAKAAANATGKRLVIVESPAKAKTINKYLGPDYIVKASVGHVRDLPSKNKKGEKSPVPGVDLENDFEPTYEVLPGKNKAVTELKQAARKATEVWFATDMDREGEAIAWHLAQILGIEPDHAQRVVFNAITKEEIKRAFSNPHTIDINKVDAQQARRILDRIVGYQVSPLLWKKIARGLSAGRVQSVAVRLIVERERLIRAHVPDESWRIAARFALDDASATKLAAEWPRFMAQRDAKNNAPTIKSQNAWMANHNAIRAELIEVAGKSFDVSKKYKPLVLEADGRPKPEAEDNINTADLTPKVLDIAELAGMTDIATDEQNNPDGRGPARTTRTITGKVDPATPYKVVSIETKRTKSRPSAPFITSTLQQGASSRLGFPARKTMRTAQSLYEGVEIKGEGSVGLITYMRTDSTHLSDEAVRTARMYIQDKFGAKYLPDKPNRYSSTNKAAQEAHEAIRPTSLAYPPDKVKSALKPEQYKLYKLIWDRFVACQMVPAEWDATSVIIEGGTDPKTPLRFRCSGRVLAFDGFYRVMGVPTSSDEQTLPAVEEGQKMSPFAMEPEQKFSSPPARFSEASLIKTLESEGIGRPSTYAQIIATIQDRNYVELTERRFYATDLGEVTTDKLVEAFPEIMELGYTREMESELDKIEEDHLDWREVLARFYGPFTKKLERAHEELTHAKAETSPAPYDCAECGAPCVYRFGKNGRFLSCSTYPDCKYAAPVDREGKPREVEGSGVACPECGTEMLKRTGRFGPFLGCARYGEKENPCATIVKLDKKTGLPVAPAPPPIETDLPCAKCDSPLYLRDGARGPWLSCSAFPKCRGRGKWSELTESKQKELEEALAKHLKDNPIPIIRDMQGNALTDEKGKPIVRESQDADEHADAEFEEVA